MSKYTNLINEDIREELEEYIFKNNLSTGDAIPSELQLCKILNCNRFELRKAIAKMVGEDILFTVHGVGTFLAPPKFEENSSSYVGFTSFWQSKGHRSSSKILKFVKTEANLKTANMLGIPLGSAVYELKRLRLIDDVLVSIETSFLEESSCPGLLTCNLDGTTSLYQVLKEKYEMTVVNQQQTIRTAKLRQEEADLLCLKEGAPAFYITAVGLTENGTCIERSISISRADRFAIRYQAKQ